MPKKKRTVAKLKKDVWKIFSRYIRLRDAIKTTKRNDMVSCITCGQWKETKSVDAGHFISRSCSYLLFDENNVHAQCKKCNMPPDPGEQHTYGERIKTLYGEKELKRLKEGKWKVFKFTKKMLEEMEQEYKGKLNDLIKKHGSPW